MAFPSAMFLNQIPGCFTPITAWPTTPFHSQAGGLHIPEVGMEIGLGTPPRRCTSEDEWMVGRYCVQYEFYNLNPFEPCRTLALDHFSHQPSDFESMDASGDRSLIDDSRIETEMHYDSPIMNASSRPDDASMFTSLPTSSEKYVSILLFLRSFGCRAAPKISIF